MERQVTPEILMKLIIQWHLSGISLSNTVRVHPIVWTQLSQEPALLWESIYYSTLTFTSLGFGDFCLVDTVGKLLTVPETTTDTL